MDKWLTHNNFAKIIALVFSIILWGMVHLDSGSPVAPTTMVNNKYIDNVKIEVTGFDEKKYVLYDLEPGTVDLEVKGKRTDITTNFSSYRVKLNLSDLGPGTYTLPLTHELPPGVQLVSMDPSVVKVSIEAKETRKVPVSIVTKGEPAGGHLLGAPVVISDDMVDVTLPASEIEELGKVEGTIDVSGIKDSLKGKSVKLIAYDKKGKEMENAELSSDSVEVDLPVIKLYKNVPLDIRQIGNLPLGYTLAGIETDVREVSIYGSKEALEGIKSYQVTVDLGRFKDTSETKFSMDLTPPEGFEKIEPGSIQITLKVEPATKKLFKDLPITLKNENSDYTVEFIKPADRKISLTLSGAEKQLQGLASKDIVITADMANLKPGLHTIPLDIKLPAYVELSEEDKTLSINVEVTEKVNSANTEPEKTPSDGNAPPENEDNSGTNKGAVNAGT